MVRQRQPRSGEVVGIDSSSFAQGRLELWWDGPDVSSPDFDPAGLGSHDLTASGAANAVLVDVYFNDVPTTLAFDVYSNAGTRMSTATLQVPAMLLEPGTATTLSLPFAAFAGDADFSTVSAIQLTGDSADGWDLILDDIRTGPAGSNPPPPTPSNKSLQPIPAGSLAVDLFEDGGFGAGLALGSSASGSTGAVSGVLGGTVGWSGAADAGGGRGNLRRNVEPALGLFNYVSDTHMVATVTLHYDGNTSSTFDPAGLGSVDLTDGGTLDRFVLGVAFDDVPADITFEVFSDAGTRLSTYILELPGMLPDGASIEFPFSLFVGDADFTSVSAVRWTLTGEPGLDLELDYLVVAPIPEPASLTALLLTGGGLLLRRRARA